ncbi:MAG: fructose 1,6-bisphosphatase [Candidatus Bipolaricaulota bacterium]|nr:fructose 1,6-bisphosphatase [Candidatus Bipolaricaulota bacterium]
MKVTQTAIKTDVGSVGGHRRPSGALLGAVRDGGRARVIGFAIPHTGGDVAVLMSTGRGTDDSAIHKLAWDVFPVQEKG